MRQRRAKSNKSSVKRGNLLQCEQCGCNYYKMQSWSIGSRFCSNKCKYEFWKKGNSPIYRVKDRLGTNKKISQGILSSEKHKKGTRSEKNRQRARQNRLGKKASESTRNKCRINALNTLEKLRKNNKISSIERKVEKVLIDAKISFETQKRILNTTKVDFYIPDKNCVVYCDGDYWHNLPDYIIRDKRINKLLIENGYKVLRFWEKDIISTKGKCVLDSLVNV